MTYQVKEIFYTLQGEGAHTGRPAVFCRFAGCNLWTGREKIAPAQSASSATPTSLARTVQAADDSPPLRSWLRRWLPRGTVRTTARARPFVVCTGGEPLLQLDEAAVEALHALGSK